jgi:pimeloyl-ACP methyl ester carboxylesterase
MGSDADLSPYGVADLISSFLHTLDLSDVTIVGNDSGGAMSQVLVTRQPERIGRLVLTNCDTHENFPPGIFKVLPPIAKLPGGIELFLAPLRIGAIARRVFRFFAKTQVPGELISSWLSPSLHNSAIRRDLRKFTAGMHKRYTLEAAEKLGSFDRPLLLAWAPGDRYFPIKYAERLAASTPNTHVVEIPDSKTFVALDQPHRLAEVIAEFASFERQVSAAEQTLASGKH